MTINNTLFLIFTAITAVGVLIQAGVLLGMFLAAARTAKKIEELSDKLNIHLVPTLASTKSIIEDLVPKLKTISEDVAAISSRVRHQADHVNSTVDEVVDKTRVQAERVDEMVTGVLNSVVHASSAIQHGVNAPIRQIAGIVNGLRAGVDTFRRKSARPNGGHDF